MPGEFINFISIFPAYLQSHFSCNMFFNIRQCTVEYLTMLMIVVFEFSLLFKKQFPSTGQ